MRGKAQRPYKPHGARGITPAYAGKRNFVRPFYPGGEDHPRLCGEKENQDGKERGLLGSPPPMRGKATVKASA